MNNDFDYGFDIDVTPWESDNRNIILDLTRENKPPPKLQFPIVKEKQYLRNHTFSISPETTKSKMSRRKLSVEAPKSLAPSPRFTQALPDRRIRKVGDLPEFCVQGVLQKCNP
jgi:hypothetical protein